MDMTDNGLTNAKENKFISSVRDSELIGMFLGRENKKESLSYTYIIPFLFKTQTCKT